jgi:hypothetical protein
MTRAGLYRPCLSYRTLRLFGLSSQFQFCLGINGHFPMTGSTPGYVAYRTSEFQAGFPISGFAVIRSQRPVSHWKPAFIISVQRNSKESLWPDAVSFYFASNNILVVRFRSSEFLFDGIHSAIHSGFRGYSASPYRVEPGMLLT